MKMFNNMMFFTALFAVTVVSAKNIGGAKAKSTVTSSVSQQQGLSTQQQEMAAQAAKRVREQEATVAKAAEEKRAQEQSKQNVEGKTSRSVTSDEWTAWDEMEDEFYDAIDSGDLRTANKLIKKMMNVSNPTSRQKAALKRMKRSFIREKASVMQRLQAEREKRRSARSWFTGWFGGEVGNYQNMIMAKLDNTEKYPTLKSKRDALDLGVEFFDAQHNDSHIMEDAIDALKAQLPQEGDSLKQERINVLNDKMRKYFAVDLTDFNSLSTEEKITYLKKYLAKSKSGMKDFVKATITNENVEALLRAILSETARINAMIDSLDSIKPAQEKSVVVPQGRPAGNPVTNESK